MQNAILLSSASTIFFRDFDFVFAYFAIKRADVYTQISGGEFAVAFAALKCFSDEKFFDSGKTHRLILRYADSCGRP